MRHPSLQILFKSPTPANMFETDANLCVVLTSGKVQNPLRLLPTTALQSKTGASMCVLTSLLQKRLEGHVLFQTPNFQQCSEPGVLGAC